MTEQRLKDIKMLRKEVLSNDEYAKIIEKYKMDQPDPDFTERRHRIITGKAAVLAEAVIAGGGTDEEVKLAILNTMICMDAMKHHLDWGRWKRDNHICLLIRKYMNPTEKEKN